MLNATDINFAVFNRFLFPGGMEGDNLPTTGNEYGRAFRDVELEKEVLAEAHKIGLGAQFPEREFTGLYIQFVRKSQFLEEG